MKLVTGLRITLLLELNHTLYIHQCMHIPMHIYTQWDFPSARNALKIWMESPSPSTHTNWNSSWKLATGKRRTLSTYITKDDRFSLRQSWISRQLRHLQVQSAVVAVNVAFSENSVLCPVHTLCKSCILSVVTHHAFGDQLGPYVHMLSFSCPSVDCLETPGDMSSVKLSISVCLWMTW